MQIFYDLALQLIFFNHILHLLVVNFCKAFLVTGILHLNYFLVLYFKSVLHYFA